MSVSGNDRKCYRNNKIIESVIRSSRKSDVLLETALQIVNDKHL